MRVDEAIKTVVEADERESYTAAKRVVKNAKKNPIKSNRNLRGLDILQSKATYFIAVDSGKYVDCSVCNLESLLMQFIAANKTQDSTYISEVSPAGEKMLIEFLAEAIDNGSKT